MEAKVMDFKQSFDLHIGKVGRKEEFKSSKFDDSLQKAHKKTSPKNEESSQGKTEVESNETKKSKEVVTDSVKKIEARDKDEKSLYAGMVNLLNIQSILADDPKINLEELDMSSFQVKEDIDLLNEIILDEETMNLIGLHEGKNDLEQISKDSLKESSKDIIEESPIELNSKEDKLDLLIQNTNRKEINMDPEDLEEDLSISEENSFMNIDQGPSGKTESEFKESNPKDGRGSDDLYELVMSSNTEEVVEVENETFGPFIKEGIEFANDIAIEAEMPEIEPKDVVKQIVDQVKFDLSEGNNRIKLSLRPESLGEMTMNLEVAKDGIIARIMVDNYRTKEIIEGNMFQLQEDIKDTGMEIKTFEVFVGNGSDFDQHNFNQSGQFNLKQNSKKLRIKAENNKLIRDYEDGTIENMAEPLNYSGDGGLNLLA